MEGARFRSPPSARQRCVPKEFQAPEARAKGEQWPLEMSVRRVRAPMEESRQAGPEPGEGSAKRGAGGRGSSEIVRTVLKWPWLGATS